MKKLMLGVAALAITAAPLAASAEPWGGHDRGWGESRGWRGDDRGDRGGAALAAGLFGFVLGSALSSNHHDYSYDRSYGYQPYGYGYAERCYWRTQAVEDGWGDVHYRQVQVCR